MVEMTSQTTDSKLYFILYSCYYIKKIYISTEDAQSLVICSPYQIKKIFFITKSLISLYDGPTHLPFRIKYKLTMSQTTYNKYVNIYYMLICWWKLEDITKVEVVTLMIVVRPCEILKALLTFFKFTSVLILFLRDCRFNKFVVKRVRKSLDRRKFTQN